MEKFFFDKPKEVFDRLNKGKKLVVFEVDDAQNPIVIVSEIKNWENVKKLKNYGVIDPAVKYMEEKYDKEIRLAKLASLCDLSTSYFCRKFKETTGMGVNDYLLHKRMDEACRLLRDTDTTVVGIAYEVGYTDCGYFNKIFKKRFSITPLEYRRKFSVKNTRFPSV